MAKKEEKTLERTYNVPLRKEYMKVPRWRRTQKAVSALRKFLTRHMKSENIKLSKELNEAVWKHGIRNPPHHVKVKVVKDDKGVVNADLFHRHAKRIRDIDRAGIDGYIHRKLFHDCRQKIKRCSRKNSR